MVSVIQSKNNGDHQRIALHHRLVVRMVYCNPLAAAGLHSLILKRKLLKESRCDGYITMWMMVAAQCRSDPYYHDWLLSIKYLFITEHEKSKLGMARACYYGAPYSVVRNRRVLPPRMLFLTFLCTTLNAISIIYLSLWSWLNRLWRSNNKVQYNALAISWYKNYFIIYS